jgi:glyoxylase-like metal-dependent hydrolase (beta-lactamase superfamily II)
MWTRFLLIDNIILDSGNYKCNRSQLRKFFKLRKENYNEWLLYNTHLHEDHCGNNRLIQEDLGAKIYVPDQLNNYYKDLSFFFKLVWGTPTSFKSHLINHQIIETAKGRKLKIIQTPGHTPNHVSYFLETENLLVTGDAIPLSPKKKYSMPEENYIQSIETLKKINGLIHDDTIIIDAHKGIIHNPKQHLQLRIDNMEEVVELVNNAWIDSSQGYKEVSKAVFGKSPFPYRYMSRVNAINTVQSIIEYSNEIKNSEPN